MNRTDYCQSAVSQHPSYDICSWSADVVADFELDATWNRRVGTRQAGPTHPAPSPRPCQNLPPAAVAMLPADTNTKVTTWQLALTDIINYILQIKQKEMALLSSNKLRYKVVQI